MKLNTNLSCFKSYDVRGKLGVEINEDVAYRIGRSLAQNYNARSVVVGFDARGTSPNLARAVTKGICEAGADVLEIGLSGTEEMYSAVFEMCADVGIEVTASHNPIEYNGMKFVKFGSEPLSEKEFLGIKSTAEQSLFSEQKYIGSVLNIKNEARRSYLKKLLNFVDLKSLRPLKIVINSGNGAAGPVIDALQSAIEAEGIKVNFVRVHHMPDSSFPNGIPNPLLEENRSHTSDVVKSEKADFGVAFDGDFDRCFIFDHLGNFVPGEYVVGLLSEIFLARHKRATIIHDPRVVWNTIDVVNKCGGRPVKSKTGHAFIKQTMRKENAIYGGEMSAHHYFQDFAYCDSGMIPWLLIWELLCKKNTNLHDLIFERQRLFPSSGEINFKVNDAAKCVKMIKELFVANANSVDEVDGLSMSFENWRFNLRESNTEPLVRLNVESRGDHSLLKKKTKELSRLIND